MSEPHRIRFKANPTQWDFITSKAEADLFACRMGEGKSAGLVWAAFHYTEQNPGAVGAMIRDTYENLRDTTLKEFFAWFPEGVACTYNRSSKTIRWRLSQLEGEIMCLGMDEPKDAQKLQSRALSYFLMDEPAPAHESGGIDEEVFDMALSRLRFPGMRWYAAKLATNNPDETHWTYRRFKDPGDPGTPTSEEIADEQERGFRLHQTVRPENTEHLPPGYYARLRQAYRHRPDLVRRFVDGDFGFQAIGRAVTPEWNDDLHLAQALEPIGRELILLWDFGVTGSCCTITQTTPLGHWNTLESHVSDPDGMGTFELIRDVVKPRLAERFHGLPLRHIGDPQGAQREQSSSQMSAVRVIREELGGPFRAGPVKLEERIPPLRSVLSRTIGGIGLVRVDARFAKPVWHALRGGYHYAVSRAGVISPAPVKDIHSHPANTMEYGAAVLFPTGRMMKRRPYPRQPRSARYRPAGPTGRLPAHGERLDGRPGGRRWPHV